MSPRVSSLHSVGYGFVFMAGLVGQPAAFATETVADPTPITVEATSARSAQPNTKSAPIPTEPSEDTGSAKKSDQISTEEVTQKASENQAPKREVATDILPSPAIEANPSTDLANATFRIDRFEVQGSTIFKPADFAKITAPFTGKEVTFAELLQARSAITKLYVEQGYVTTGATIAPQALENGVVRVQVVEGTLEEIRITGNHRLSAKYIRDRIKLGAGTPLNVPKLLANLQQLRLDPRVSNLSADLQAGIRPGSNLLKVEVQEADTFSLSTSFDNGRSPSVGSFRRKLELREGNLLGFGDAVTFAYSNTRGSNTIDLNYTVPINARNGAVWFSYGSSSNTVIEAPFSVLDIQSRSRYYELGFRQPLLQSTTRDFAMGFAFSRQTSQTELGLDDIGPFPLSPGADNEGRTKVSALRFFQEYTQRSVHHVLALRSQFSLGLNWLDASVSENAPDSRFFSWRGQGQWLRQVAPDTVFLVKGDVQLSGDSLVPLEQFGLGGQMTVRGFRQDALLTDSGALFSAEFRFPIARSSKLGMLQLVPFVDVGTGWNLDSATPSPSTLVGTGLGLLWKAGDRFNARLDWGIPLTSLSGEKSSLQENGVYFSVNYTLF